jgi:hypothetical protein
MQLTGRTSRLPLARVLTLVALLCTGALQVQEAGHGHWYELDDSYSQCLVCKSSGAAALPLETLLPVIPRAVQTDAPRHAAVAAPGAASPYDARGPPHYS